MDNYPDKNPEFIVNHANSIIQRNLRFHHDSADDALGDVVIDSAGITLLSDGNTRTRHVCSCTAHPTDIAK